MAKATLYYMSTCGYCLKVLDFMQKNDITIPLKNVLESSEVKQELISIGGKSQVPCLVVDGEAIYESDGIIEWLKEHKYEL